MKNTKNKYGAWALITGGSSGIGYAFAQNLAAKGHNLILVARNQDALDARAKELATQYNIEVDTITQDLTAPDAAANIYAQSQNKKPGLIVLNAGMETTGHFTKVSTDAHRSLIKINVQAPAELARLFGADMIDRQRGGIVFLSSLFGYQGIPLLANYAASKAYILTLGEALYVEMKPHGVDVLVLSPGLTDTDMVKQMPINFGKMPITKHTPAKVAQIGMNALGHKPTVVPGLMNKIYAFENRFMPRIWPTKLFGFLLKNAMKKGQRPALLTTRKMKVAR
jgi:short-subunit dehydrogenase